MYKGGEFSMEEYKKYCITLDKDITVIRGETEMQAYAYGIAKSGGLLVETESGKRIEVNSGEVSIRPAKK